ncbi:P-loop containing nucleoside triphosphate hydrolase protein [Phyllosticta citribraziliensis]|uniref:P-loop containing nucleoside triphosphate hydrolase protein n=1 Tax=Phyllosticta citribraziliensis TaxID=989973 RepID=A0ABR1LSZ1_9PEZI
MSSAHLSTLPNTPKTPSPAIFLSPSSSVIGVSVVLNHSSPASYAGQTIASRQLPPTASTRNSILPQVAVPTSTSAITACSPPNPTLPFNSHHHARIGPNSRSGQHSNLLRPDSCKGWFPPPYSCNALELKFVRPNNSDPVRAAMTGRAFNFPCILAIKPMGDTEPTVVGAEAYVNDLKIRDGIPHIDSSLLFEEHRGYDSVVDCNLRCYDLRNNNVCVKHTSDILVRLNRTTVVDENGKPSRMTAEMLTDDTMDKAMSLFGLERGDLARCIGVAAKMSRPLHILKVSYAKYPPSIGLETRWISHGSHQATIEKVRQCFAQNGTIYALGWRLFEPTKELEEFNRLFEKLRQVEPLHQFYRSSAINFTCSDLKAKEERKSLRLPAQIVFSEWLQYATIMRIAATEEEEGDAARFDTNQSKIRLVLIADSASGCLFGVLEHDPQKYRLGRGEMLKIYFGRPTSETVSDNEDASDDMERPSANATVVEKNFSTLPKTVTLRIRQDVNDWTNQWNANVLSAAITVGSTASESTICDAIRQAPQLGVDYRNHDEGKAIHIQRSLRALQIITEEPGCQWVKGVLLGHMIPKQKSIDMYADVERDEQASEALWLAMSRLNPGQAAALELTRALPNGVGIVEGPPGTGKTFLIANMVQPLVFSDRRSMTKGPPVLLLSTSNLSVDDIAVRVKSLCDQTSRQLASTRNLTVVRLHSMETERLLFLNNLPTYHNAEIVDERLRLEEYSLANLMFQMSGFMDSLYAKKGQSRFSSLRNLCQCFRRKEMADQELKAQLDLLVEELRTAALMKADVVVASLGVAGDRQLFNFIKPSAIIVDEASRATDPDLWPIFARYPKGTKLLVGDSKQLQPATSFQNSFRDQRLLSAMTRLRKIGYPAKMLVEQRRSVSSIAKIYSDTFYEGGLVTPASVNKRLNEQALPFRRAMQKEYSLGADDRSAFFFHVKYGDDQRESASKSHFNVVNVKIVMDCIRRLVHEGISASRIALLVPYTAQRDLYDIARSELAKATPSISDLQLETFDSVQGREFDFVIVDFVRTSKIGFLKENNRVNVAISRAQYGLIIVLNRDSLKNKDEYAFDRSSFPQVYRHLKQVFSFSKAQVNKLAAISGLDEAASAKAGRGRR